MQHRDEGLIFAQLGNQIVAGALEIITNPQQWMQHMHALFDPAKSLTAIVAVVLTLTTTTAVQQAKAGVEKLYILNCGEGVAGDISRWSPGVNVGKPMDFVDNCYLMHHTQGWLLWDTGITDGIAVMPNGLAPSDPKAVFWHRPKTL